MSGMLSLAAAVLEKVGDLQKASVGAPSSACGTSKARHPEGGGETATYADFDVAVVPVEVVSLALHDSVAVLMISHNGGGSRGVLITCSVAGFRPGIEEQERRAQEARSCCHDRPHTSSVRCDQSGWSPITQRARSAVPRGGCRDRGGWAGGMHLKLAPVSEFFGEKTVSEVAHFSGNSNGRHEGGPRWRYKLRRELASSTKLCAVTGAGPYCQGGAKRLERSSVGWRLCPIISITLEAATSHDIAAIQPKSSGPGPCASTLLSS